MIDLDIVNDFRQVFLSGSLDATNYDGLTQVYAAAQGSVPDSKIGMAAAFRALDTAADPKTGFFADGTLAVEGLGTWAAAHNVGAAGVTNVSAEHQLAKGDYFCHFMFLPNYISQGCPCRRVCPVNGYFARAALTISTD